MPFGVVFGIGAAVVAIGFVTVISLVIYRAIRSVRDPEYRAYLEAQSSTASRRRSAMGMNSAMGMPYDPTSDPGNPASPMFPGNPGNPI